MGKLRLIFERQWLHWLLLAVLLGAFGWIARFYGHLTTWDGELWHVPTSTWAWIAVGVAVAHQFYAWFCWRTELHASLLSRWLGRRAFALYAVPFSLLVIGRGVTVFLLAVANRRTIPLDATAMRITAVCLLLLALYLLYSVIRYFGLRRAMGIDHFDTSYRELPLVREGIFRVTRNGMYTFGFLVLWAFALWYGSMAALAVALFQHVYIWVHYTTTELPDLRRIYGVEDRLGPILLRWAGVLLCTFGVVTGYLWHWHLLPLRHYGDYHWKALHSDYTRWQDCKERVYRHGDWSSHGDELRRWGDKEITGYLIERLEPGQELDTCAAGHLSPAFEYITNQTPGTTADAWIAWWEENKHLTQEQWVADGFKQHGIELETPMTHGDHVELLAIIGGQGEELPSHVWFNAQRWLRDHGFETHTVTMADLQGDDAEHLLAGLVAYSEFVGRSPANDVGSLTNPPDEPPCPADMGLNARLDITIGANLIIFTPLFVGCLLFLAASRVSSRKAKKELPGDNV